MHVEISQRGFYTFRSESRFNSEGSLYNGTFDPNFRGINLVASGDYIASTNQFIIGYPLETNATYILVYSTYYSKTTGDFRVVSVGPEALTLIPYKVPSKSTRSMVIFLKMNIFFLFSTNEQGQFLFWNRL